MRELERENEELRKQMDEVEEVRALQEEHSTERLAERERSLAHVQQDLYSLQMRFKEVDQQEQTLTEQEDLYRTTHVRFEEPDQLFTFKGLKEIRQTGETDWHKAEADKWQRQVDAMREDADKIHELVCQIGA